MGVWGTAIFSDDVAADVRDMFTEFAAEGLTPAEATERLICESAEILADPEETIVFWLALAAIQWKLGRLLDDVRTRAIGIIDGGADLARWRDGGPAQVKQRTKHLTKLREQLCAPPASPKKLKAFVKATTDLRPGDICVFRAQDGTAVRFCVLDMHTDRGGTSPKICLLGLDDGQPFRRRSLSLAETLGPHYTMVSHEPRDQVAILARDIAVPAQTTESTRVWNSIAIRGHVCTWKAFPDALRSVLPKLGWR